MSSRATLDLEAYQGDAFSYTLNFVDGNDAPIDLSGATWAGFVRKTNSPTGAKLAEFTVNTSGQAGGTIVLELTTAVTLELTKNAFWDLQRDDIDRTYLGGKFTTHKQITTS